MSTRSAVCWSWPYCAHVGFFGTFVLARSADLLVNEEAVLGFGYQHEQLYELGDGWQLLETRGIRDPQDFAAASERFVTGTGRAVLAAYVNDGDCLGVYGQTPDGWTTSFHLPTDQAPCFYKHRPPLKVRTTEAVATDLERWARAAGLCPDPEQIPTIAAYDHRSEPGCGHELPLEMLPALGLPEAGEPRPTSIDLEEEPWCAIVGFLGVARQAYNRIAERADSRERGEPFHAQQRWERAAIELEADIWAARHHLDADTTALRARAEWLCHAYMSTERRPVPRGRT
jgi:hypothetical protein